MKEKLVALILGIIFGICITATSCNYNPIDLTYTYNKAYIEGIGIVEISSWTEYDNSDNIQVTAKDGTIYYGNNIILIKE